MKKEGDDIHSVLNGLSSNEIPKKLSFTKLCALVEAFGKVTLSGVFAAYA